MSIVNELHRISQAKADLKASIEAKGVTIEDTATIDTFASKVDEIIGSASSSIKGTFKPTADTGIFELNGLSIKPEVFAICCNGLYASSVVGAVVNCELYKEHYGCCSYNISASELSHSMVTPNSAIVSWGEDSIKISVPTNIAVFKAGYTYDYIIAGEGENSSGDNGGESDSALIDSIIQKTITHLESGTATTVANTAFSDFTTLQYVNLPAVEIVSSSAFRRCYALADVNLPNVKTLMTECFYGDNNLTYIDLPLITQIQKGAFSSSGLETLIIRTGQLCTLQNVSALSNTPIANGTGFIYVPDELAESYKSATNWSTYAAQIKGISELEGVSV